MQVASVLGKRLETCWNSTNALAMNVYTQHLKLCERDQSIARSRSSLQSGSKHFQTPKQCNIALFRISLSLPSTVIRSKRWQEKIIALRERDRQLAGTWAIHGRANLRTTGHQQVQQLCLHLPGWQDRKCVESSEKLFFEFCAMLFTLDNFQCFRMLLCKPAWPG